VLSDLPVPTDPRVLVDYRNADDAGVFVVGDVALVQTVDFFTPVVDDPYAFGAIAAANAVSDVYAMGGRPLTALSIAAFPEDDFPLEWAQQIVRGGAEALARAGCALIGGHSVRDPELKFGYAVTGLVDPERLLTNAGGHPGQVLVLTKPLGTGVIATALKAGEAPEATVVAATNSMMRLNREACEAALAHGVTAATDVTGFGLAGHAAALARESRLTLEFELKALPLLPGALELAERFQARGLKANRREFEPLVEYGGRSEAARKALAYDPQTSGGLLLLVPEPEVEALIASVEGACIVGLARSAGTRALVFRS
jgi:selenide,water dikinase